MSAKNLRGIALASGAVVLGLGYLFANGAPSWRGSPQANAAAPTASAPALPVPVAAVVKKSVPIYLDYVGTTEAIRSVMLQAKVTGYLAERGPADGADVKQGDLLYRIDARDYQAALDQVTAQAARDAAALDYSRSTQGRNAALAKEGWTSKETYEQTTSSLRQSEASLSADQAAIRAAKLNLAYTEIRAPFDGRLGRSLVHEGALITAAGTQLNSLVQLDPIYATFNPSERDLAAIEARRGAGDVEAQIYLEGDSKPHYLGTLTFLDNSVDRATGTITARATIANPRHTLLPGQFIRVRLHLGETPDALLVPQVAVGSSQIGKFVYVVGADGKADQRLVQVGAVEGDLVVVTGGLKEGDKVITGNLQKIGPGSPVQPLPPGPAMAAK